MSTSPTFTRLGASALLLAGVLFLAYPVVRPWHDETTTTGASAAMGSGAWVASHLFAMLGFILLPIGLLAVVGVLVNTRVAHLAVAATVVTWVGAGLVLPYYGAEDFGLHAIAGPQGAGADLLELVEAIRFQPVAMTTFGAGLILLAIGAILAAVAVWRSGVLPRWGGVPLAVGLALFLPQFYTPPAARIAHGVLMAAGLILLGVALWRRAGSLNARPERQRNMAGAGSP